MLKVAMHDKQIKHQLVTPHSHRANMAERAIKTFKHYFKAIIASVDPAFSIAQWDRLLKQAELTLNILRSSRVNPNISAHTFLHGEFNFFTTLLAPSGTRVFAHTKTGVQSSLA